MTTILIVDDSPAKIRNVVQWLGVSCGINRSDITVAQCATDARERLTNTSFDIMILDLALPLRPEDEPSFDVSLELLDEIVARDIYRRPRQIVGLTAYSELAGEAERHFSERLWDILLYEDENDSWRQRLANCVSYIQDANKTTLPSLEFKTDVCIITALRTPELSSFERLPWHWQPATPIDDVTFIRRGSFESRGKTYSVIASAAPRMGMVATALLSSKLIDVFRPRFLVMGGICAGVRGQNNYGDVILADPSWDWQSGKRVKDGENSQFSIAPHQLSVSNSVRSYVLSLSEDSGLLSEIRSSWPATPPNSALQVLVGPVASGSAVLADGRVVEDIRQQHRSLLGIEMEIYGLYAAAAQSSAPRPVAFALKSVCDFADPDKGDAMQAYAAYTSAAVIRQFFERYMAEFR